MDLALILVFVLPWAAEGEEGKVREGGRGRLGKGDGDEEKE